MLQKIKQTWRGVLKTSLTRASTSPEPASGNVESSADSSADPFSDLSPEDDDDGPIQTGVKRPRSSKDELEAVEERPAKIVKSTAASSLRFYLPEFIDVRDQDESYQFLPIITLKDQVLEQTKNENIIAVVPHIRASAVLLTQVIGWMAAQEHNRSNRNVSGPRCAIVVIDDSALVEAYSTYLESDLPSLTFKRYTEEIHRPDVELWTELLNYDVIMMSSKLLLECLQCGALSLPQTFLLVVTDGQGIKNQDSHSSLPIVRVMDEFYRPMAPSVKPRVFSLAIVGTNHRSHFDSKMLTLELTLDSHVFGVKPEKRAEVLALPDRPNELVVFYDNPQPSEDTKLLKQLHQLDPSEVAFRRHFRASRHANFELGSCASDLVWRRALKDIDAGLQPWDDYDEDDVDISTLEHCKGRIRRVVKNWPFTMPSLDSSSRGFNVSHKFLRLVQTLLPFKKYGEGFRGIIFVQRRVIASVLVDLLRTLDDLGFLRPIAVVGKSNQDYHDIFERFATGVFNLIVATKSLEDLDVPKASIVIQYDLFESQISHAYIRSRTRGRESHLIHLVERGNDVHRRILSRVTALDSDMVRWAEFLYRTGDSFPPPSSLRESINPYHSDSEDEDATAFQQPHLKDPTTSGRIYLEDATTAIYRYAASLRGQGLSFSEAQPMFEYLDPRREFGSPQSHVAKVYLPGTPVDGVTGGQASSKAQARRLAAFKACERLLELGYLDCQLVPLPDNLRPQKDSQPTDDLGDSKTSGSRKYGRKVPDFWWNANQLPTSTFYPTVIYIPDTEDGIGTYGPVAVLTRKPLPDLRSFKLFFSGIALQARFQRALPLTLAEEQLSIIHRYTLRICRGITNKALSCPLEEMPYFFMAVGKDWRPVAGPTVELQDLAPFIPWGQMEVAAKHWAVPIRHMSSDDTEEDLEDAIIQDRVIEFTRRYRVARVRRDLTPLSKPADSLREAEAENLYEFCKSKRKTLEGLENYAQPIAEVVKLPALMNHLNPMCKPPANTNKLPVKYLIPELCAKFTVPASTMRTAMLLPSILRKLDDLLLAKELNAKFFDHVIREDLLHIATCTPSAGLESDYERLELLGDAFLKYLSSIYVFVTNPSLNEGSLHLARQKLISNKVLLHHAVRIGLPPYIQSKIFAFKSWMPPNFSIYQFPKTLKLAAEGAEKQEVDGGAEGQTGVEERVEGMTDAVDEKLEGEESPGMSIDQESAREVAQGSAPDLEPGEIIEEVKHKSTAVEHEDVAVKGHSQSGEIAIEPADAGKGPGEKSASDSAKKKKAKKKKSGADEQNVQWLGDKAVADVTEAIIGAAYISGGREAALQVTKALTIPISNVDRWSDFGRKVLTPPPGVTAKLRPGAITAIERIIGHKFARPHLLAQAMTHSSIQGYESTSYERLEFVGDAILDFMVIRYIFDRDQQLSPGALTMLKGAMVSNSTLGAVCVWSGMHEHLLFDSTQLANSIEAYVRELKILQDKEYELARAEGRATGQYWISVEPPKALSDVVESIVGAVYISDNFSPIGAEALFDNVLKPFYDKHITLQTLSHHPTKILFELLQAQGCQVFGLTRDKEGGLFRCSVLVHDIVLASADDAVPAVAARVASFMALDALEGDAEFMSRSCDCRTHGSTKKPRKKSEYEQALESLLLKGDEEDLGDDTAKEESQVMESLVEDHR